MSKKTLDCTGLSCPVPIIKAKHALETGDFEVLDVIVDDEIAEENIIKLAKSMGLSSTSAKNNNSFIVTIDRSNISDMCIENNYSFGKTILIKTEHFGNGNDELGSVLMKAFIFTIAQTEPYPEKLIFINSGVKLTTTNEETIKNLLFLKEQGTEIVSCGTCLDFYGLKDKLKVGSIGNMYSIVDSLNKSTNTLTI